MSLIVCQRLFQANRFFSVSLVILLLAGCASKPLRVSQLNEGQWQSRVDVLNKKTGKKMPLTVTFKALSGKSLRLDITTATGIYVGSVLDSDEQFKALIARERKFYRGASTAKAMKKVISVPVDPSWLDAILFELPPESWQCEFDENKYLEKCLINQQDIAVQWSDRNDNRKLIQISSPSFELKIYLGQFFSAVQNKEKAFRLAPPKGFKIITIR